MTDDQVVDQDGWPKWQDVRQSKRIRSNGGAQQKMSGQDAYKTHQDMKHEGTLSSHKNSFAVLFNTHIIDLATKMGIHYESLSFEKIDLLKDLENARMKLNEHANVPANQNNSLEEETFSLEDQNVLDWGTEESKEEPCILNSSVRKSRSPKKYKKKSRVVRKHPLDTSVCSEGDKSKVSSRSNLRDRDKIKRVFK
jgi:hypothetical protein